MKNKKILLVGGSGKVGSFITPYLLKKGYDVKVMDLSTPEHDVEFINGSVLNPEDISKAILDIDSFIWVVMKSPQGGSVTDQDLTVIKNNYRPFESVISVSSQASLSINENNNFYRYNIWNINWRRFKKIWQTKSK